MNKKLVSAAMMAVFLAGAGILCASERAVSSPGAQRRTVKASGLRGKVMAGYQGWFRTPGDTADLGWAHWSRDSSRLTPETLTFEMWPDMSEYTPTERYPAPGFTYPDGRQAELFSSDNARTVLRHFQWMQTYGIDGAWLQRFLVDLSGGPEQVRYESRNRVLRHVRQAARKTGRVWALTYDIAGTPSDSIYTILTEDWKKMVDDGITRDPRYLRDKGRPVVKIWGFYHNHPNHGMRTELAGKLIDFFQKPGRYSAYLVGGGAWDWRGSSPPDWQRQLFRLDAYVPWNVGNYAVNDAGVRSASMGYWSEDKKLLERHGVLWIPSVYPGFGWDNLKQQPPGTFTIPRRKGRFLWEQFYTVAKLGGDSAYVAMFDEVDEATAIFKITNAPPTQAHFLDYEGLPSDWYLRLTGEGTRMLRGQRALTEEIPIKP